MSQVTMGKAFEYVCLETVRQRASSLGINVKVTEDSNFKVGKANFEALSSEQQTKLKTGSDVAIKFIFEHEPYLKDDVTARHLKLKMASDKDGQEGDVRDILILRWSDKRNKEWSCGISCKHNHDAIKHPRVPIRKDGDFLSNWTKGEFSMSKEGLEIIEKLGELLDTKVGKTWKDSFVDKETAVYKPIIKVVAQEIESRKENAAFVKTLFQFLLGKFDFYKVMSYDEEELTRVTIFDFNGTLNQPSDNLKPSKKIKKTPLPKKILSVWNDNSYIEIHFDGGWAIRMRLHNASSKIEKSLKFDARLLGIPESLLNLSFDWKKTN